MKAVTIEKPGGPDVLKIETVTDPRPQRGEVLVKVMATAINRADLLQREGKYPPPPDAVQNIPGLEYSGEIAELGECCADWASRDRVFGLVAGGSYAEYVVVHHRTLNRIPDNLSYDQAAALPEACITAYDAMVDQCALTCGETLLINGITSGVGTAALQIANAMGVSVIGTTRSASKVERLNEFGPARIVVSGDGKFSKTVLDEVSGGVDVILELIGGNYLQEDLVCLAPKGRIILVGLLGGPRCEVSLANILARRARIFGTTLRARPLEEKIRAAQLFQKAVVPLIASGRVKPVIDKIFSLDQIQQAHSYMASNESFGKIVVRMPN
jgi:putative PIG3 family NAD(P)H quinone oxidoreductase